MDDAADKDFFGGQKGKAAGEVKPDLPAEDAFKFYPGRMGNFPLPVIKDILQKIQILVFRMIFIHIFYSIKEDRICRDQNGVITLRGYQLSFISLPSCNALAYIAFKNRMAKIR